MTKHWSYREVGRDEDWSCENLDSREDAIEEGLAEYEDDDAIEVFQCEAMMPDFPSIDMDWLLERYTDDRQEFPDWGYLDELVKPKALEAQKALEEACRPHWEAIGELIKAHVRDVCGDLHMPSKIEVVHRDDQEKI